MTSIGRLRLFPFFSRLGACDPSQKISACTFGVRCSVGFFVVLHFGVHFLMVSHSNIIKKGGLNKTQPGCNSHDQPEEPFLVLGLFKQVCSQCHIQAGNSCF